MRRLSIRSLMAFIVAAAVGLAALRNANELWAGMLLLVALAAVGFALMGAAILRGKERYWWAGFAFFGGAYLALSVGPWLSDTFRPQLGTTHLLDHLQQLMFASGPQALRAVQVRSLSLQAQKLETELARVARNPDADPAVQVLMMKLQAAQGQLAANKTAAPHTEDFHSVGHSLFAILAGLVGGAAARWLYVRREGEGLPVNREP
jgi:hypothetical protein